MGNSDPKTFGQLHVYEEKPEKNHVAPITADAKISSTQAVSRTLTLLSQNGSTVLLGNTLLVPVATSVMYVRPLYLESNVDHVSQPLLTKVIGVLGARVVMSTTLPEMLQGLLGVNIAGTSPPTTTPTTKPTTTQKPTPPTQGSGTAINSQDVAKANDDLTQAAADFTAAQTALQAGNLGTYQKDVQAAQSLSTQAEKLLSQASQTATSGGATTTTTSTPSPSSGSTTTTSTTAAGAET
jgi:uncharacterized membrane protein (UPF0182 family)